MACTSCADGTCATVRSDCINDPVCGPYRACANACMNMGCVNGCQGMHPGYHAKWDPFIDCLCGQCKASCTGFDFTSCP
jgi:hypothetical protein